jgi:uncharacterized membrane protein
MSHETRTKSAIKSITYVVTHEILFFIISWIFTGSIATALSIAVVGSLVELGYHYIHERIWAKIDVKQRGKK